MSITIFPKLLYTVSALMLSHALFGCGDSALNSTPTAATPTPAPLTITAIAPSVGATGGGTRVRITGTGFLPASVMVTIGARAARVGVDPRDAPGTTLYAMTSAHPAGAVDVVIADPDGTSAILTGGYTYMPATAFDLNGRWSGYGTAGQDIPLGFTIENNLLITFSCDVAALEFSPGIPVVDGEFTLPSREDGIVFSGRVVGAGQAVGMMHFGACTNTGWSASRAP